MIEKIRQQAASATTGLKESAVVHIELESHKEKSDSPDKALKMSQKKFATIKDVVEKQRARLDAVGSRMAELKDLQDEARVSTATCRKELLQMQKICNSSREGEG